ncbi:ankyrin repeat and protein kinase domain-containing protein [Anaeramoeba ignava]|uniref:Ankyrin repeat and protein kinase domain-containing protein n=1 Tax=Anaeramoeba ignava TaxID=1746090 RepID=A0A9Q0R9X7_ANAIG|nr:ankyrin repeat and protein kinase domain-containing protein [Anaeramoeba ignava]
MNFDFELKLVLVGEENVGISSFIHSFIEPNKKKKRLPLGMTKNKIIEVQGRKVNVKVLYYDFLVQFDIGIVKNIDGLIVVYDVTSEKSFKSSARFLPSITGDRKKQFDKFLIANKVDLTDQRAVFEEEGKNFARTNNMIYIETIAKNPEIVNQSFVLIVSKILERKKGWSLLHLYTENNDLSSIKKCIDKKMNINQTNDGTTALLIASFYGFKKVIRYLLKKKASPNIANNQVNGLTPLLVSCQKHYDDIVKLLLKFKANPNSSTNGLTPLFVSLDSPTIVELLLANKADFREQNKGITPLIHSTIKGYTETVRILLNICIQTNTISEANTALIYATKYRQISVLKLLLSETDIDPNYQDRKNSALHYAALNGFDKIVENLLERGANINIKNHGDTPLIIACNFGHKRVVKKLLARGANVNQANNGNTPLLTACIRGFPDIAEELLKKEAIVDFPNYGFTALHAVSMLGDLNMLKLLIEYKADVNKQNMGDTTLAIAARNGHFDIVEILIEHKAFIDHKNAGETPLFLACRHGYQEIVHFLLESYADVETQTVYETPLHVACFQNKEEIVAKLLLHLASVHTKNIGQNALHIASIHGNLSVIKILIKYLSDIDETDSGYTALHLAVLNQHFECSEILINAGAGIEAKTHGSTPLHIASGIKNIAIVKQLLDLGAFINSYDKKMTPLHIAAQIGDIEVVTLLLQKGAFVDFKNLNQTPLNLASSFEFFEICQHLLNSYAESQIESKGFDSIKIGLIIDNKDLLNLFKTVEKNSDEHKIIVACKNDNLSELKKRQDLIPDCEERGLNLLLISVLYQSFKCFKFLIKKDLIKHESIVNNNFICGSNQ